VLLVGCGALGTVIADQLVRAGIGFLRICDRDLVEETNLQRQVLFDEQDVREETPKAVAAKRRLERVNSSVTIDAHVLDVHSGNIEALMGAAGNGSRVNVILDGTDNVETRYLVNDAAIKHGISWVYGACVGVEGRVMGIVPGKGGCLRCLFEQPAGVGELETCDTAGVLASAASMVASMQVVLAIKMLLGKDVTEVAKLMTLNAWDGRVRNVDVATARREDCVCCGQGKFEFLDRAGGLTVTMCGRGAVQVRPAVATALDLDAVARRLGIAGETRRTEYFVRCQIDGKLALTVFGDGRAMVHGTADVGVARSIYARYVGN
jgi:adenylyltransferase/sulfurtransferase